MNSGAIFKHLKTGGFYRFLHVALMEDTLNPVVVYKAMDDKETVWVRPVSEFFDGRFERVAPEEIVIDPYYDTTTPVGIDFRS